MEKQFSMRLQKNNTELLVRYIDINNNKFEIIFNNTNYYVEKLKLQNNMIKFKHILEDNKCHIETYNNNASPLIYFNTYYIQCISERITCNMLRIDGEFSYNYINDALNHSVMNNHDLEQEMNTIKTNYNYLKEQNIKLVEKNKADNNTQDFIVNNLEALIDKLRKDLETSELTNKNKIEQLTKENEELLEYNSEL